jgi:hypothetical protein
MEASAVKRTRWKTGRFRMASESSRRLTSGNTSGMTLTSCSEFRIHLAAGCCYHYQHDLIYSPKSQD